MYYDSDAICSYPERFLVSELIREKILFFTQEEIPHSVAVVTDSMKKKGDTYIVNATIIVDRDSLRKIIVGANGQMIKVIGREARLEMEEILGKKVYLELYCKTIKKWREKEKYIKDLGYLINNEE